MATFTDVERILQLEEAVDAALSYMEGIMGTHDFNNSATVAHIKMLYENEMSTAEALDIIKQIQDDQGEGLLETLMYMNDNLDQFDAMQQRAFRVAYAGFRKLFAC